MEDYLSTRDVERSAPAHAIRSTHSNALGNVLRAFIDEIGDG